MKTLAICNKRNNSAVNAYFTELNFYDNNFIFGLLEIEKLDVDSIKLEKHEVAVKILAFSCNYRDRSLMLTFNQKCRAYANSNQMFYSSFGSDFVASVVKVGFEVSNFQVGDRVIPDCTYPQRIESERKGVPTNFASQRIQKFEVNQLIKIPDSMPNDVAAGFSIASQTVYSMIRKANIKGGENVVVTSATSNTSLALISALKAKNVHIYAMTKNLLFKTELLDMGVKEVISFDKIINKNKPQINRDIDVVFDPFFDLHFNFLVYYLRDFGRYIYCGMYMQNKAFDKLIDKNDNFFNSFTYSIMKNISIIGNCLGNKNDLENAISDFIGCSYKIVIDSVYNENNIKLFLEKSFSLKRRFGKVLYCYE